jgi:hypothetical protein
MSQAKKNLGCIQGGWRHWGLLQKSWTSWPYPWSSTNGREKMKWIRLPHQENTEPLSWCELPRVAVTPSPSKERRTFLQNRQSAIWFRKKTKSLTPEEAGRSYISMKRHISLCGANRFWTPPWDIGRFGPRPLCSCLGGLHQRISNRCWPQLKGNGDGHGHATAWAPEPLPPLPSTRACAVKSSWVVPFQSEGSRGSEPLLDIPQGNASWCYLCNSLSLKPACWTWPLRISNISNMPPCN